MSKTRSLQKQGARPLVLASLFVVLGVLLPFLTSHMLGVPGTTLLPMHLPVLLCGLVCGPLYGVLCGILAPSLSCLLTGMPVAFPMLPIMLCELSVYGLSAGLLYRRLKAPFLVSLPLAMAAGRGAYALAFAAIMKITGGTAKALSVSAAFVAGLPGIATQLILIPLVFQLLVKSGVAGELGDEDTFVKNEKAIASARVLIQEGTASCVLVKNGEIIHTAEGRGVAPLIWLLDNKPGLMKDALVVDKIIGKAAAMALLCGGAKSVWALTMSRPAQEYLRERGVAAECGMCIESISNRSGDGICPLERSVYGIDDPQEGLARLRETIAELMANARAAAPQPPKDATF